MNQERYTGILEHKIIEETLTMNKILPNIVFVILLLFSAQSVSAQTSTPSATPTTSITSTPTATPTLTGTASATTKGGLSTESATTELPVTGAFDNTFFLMIGGIVLVALAGVSWVKLEENLD